MAKQPKAQPGPTPVRTTPKAGHVFLRVRPGHGPVLLEGMWDYVPDERGIVEVPEADAEQVMAHGYDRV